uniref:Uncharacterized protein n=1 Tax=Cyclopterus lumpus TaxID=8103 RepID=A0A8C3A538_CYCLU
MQAEIIYTSFFLHRQLESVCLSVSRNSLYVITSTWDRFHTENSSRTSSFKNLQSFFGFDAVRDFIMPLLQAKPHPDGLCIYRHSPLLVRVTCADIYPVAVRLMQVQQAKAFQAHRALLQFCDEDPDARLLWLENEAQEPGVMAADVGVQEVGELRGMYCYQETPHSIV